MTDSMNFGPDWIRNLSSEGSTGGGTSGGTRYQLADFREAGRGRPTTLSGPPRGRGGSLERGGRISRGRGGYQYGRGSGYESGWGNGEQPDWSPRKEYGQRTMSMDNWRRTRNNEDDDGWRNVRGSMHEKWGRSTSWRGEGIRGKGGPPERGNRTTWHDLNRAPPSRRSCGIMRTTCLNGLQKIPQRAGLEGKPPNKKDMGLQKSTSQQHISNKSMHPPLSSSKSTMSLVNKSEENANRREKKSVPNIPEKVDKEVVVQQRAKSEGPPKPIEKQPVITNGPVHATPSEMKSPISERFQEDFVLKLVVDEEPPKQTPSNFEVGGIQPPPNLVAPPMHDKWFYQDPQGQMQGPFSNIEMAEWYKAGYFSNQLKVRRQCDERFFLLGELIKCAEGRTLPV
ncbi:hypothetical protein NQ318_004168, partial [Aromia moschata]